ncbi:MAG TPA: hypothetical protein VGG75_14320 [Trebonia sp.]|jgi:hypothetical protein
MILLSTTFADNLLGTGTEGVATQIGGGTLIIYSGTAPTGPNEGLSGNTALATFTFSAAGSQGSPASGSMTLVFAATTVTAAASATATFFRIASSVPTALIQGTVGTSGADFNLSSTTITSGDNVAITGTPTISWTVT